MPQELKDTVAVVTGSSRGIGKGIALALGEAGGTVYVTGRSTREHPGALPGTIEDTAQQVTERGGLGIAVHADFHVDTQIEALFERVLREQKRIDVLVNNAFATPEMDALWGGERFWEIPLALWDDMLSVGLRSHYVAARFAARAMVQRSKGVIVNVGSPAAVTGKSARSRVALPYSVGKAALYRLTSDMAVELSDRGVAVYEIWPPATKIEAVLAEPEKFGDLSGWREPVYTGRVLAALLAQDDGLARTGKAFAVEDLAKELGVGP